MGVGLAPDAGGLFLLGRAIGLSRATQLAMTGEPLGAEKALEYGVVYKVSEVEKLDKTANQLLMKLRRSSDNSFAAIKELAWSRELLPIQSVGVQNSKENKNVKFLCFCC